MIKFYFEDDYAGARAQATVTTRGEHIESVVSAFKVFLAVAGYHQDVIARIEVRADDGAGRGTEGLRMGDGNSQQGDFFAGTGFFSVDDSDDTDEESGV